MENNFKTRLIEEQKELQIKLDKLIDFIDTDTYINLEEKQRTLLFKQMLAMNQYNQILVERIHLLG